MWRRSMTCVQKKCMRAATWIYTVLLSFISLFLRKILSLLLFFYLLWLFPTKKLLLHVTKNQKLSTTRGVKLLYESWIFYDGIKNKKILIKKLFILINSNFINFFLNSLKLLWRKRNIEMKRKHTKAQKCNLWSPSAYSHRGFIFPTTPITRHWHRTS